MAALPDSRDDAICGSKLLCAPTVLKIWKKQELDLLTPTDEVFGEYFYLSMMLLSIIQ